MAARRQLGSSDLLPSLVARLGLDWDGFRRVQGGCASGKEPYSIAIAWRRNLAFTSFDEGSRARVASALIDVLRPGGVLLIGAKEALPPDIGRVHERHRGIYEKPADG